MIRRMSNRNMDEVNGGLIVKVGNRYYVLSDYTRQGIPGSFIIRDEGVCSPALAPDNSAFGCPTLEKAIKLDKEYNPDSPDAGNYYIVAPNEYASKIRYGLPALNELYDDEINYPRLKTSQLPKNANRGCCHLL